MYIYIYIYTRVPCPLFELAASARSLGICATMMCDVHATVSFHSFKSQNFKLSVSNPRSKYVAYSSVLSQISNCQGLGRTMMCEN